VLDAWLGTPTFLTSSASLDVCIDVGYSLLLLLQPHRAPVADMAIDASGGYLASGSADRAIKVTDLAGGYVTHHFTGHG
jgi:WD40 repeat protein